jgi:hypothetical protein
MIKTFTPTVQIINEQGVKTPCIARIYKDGQWRQCRLQYYKLYPLIAKPFINEPIDETIYDAYSRPIYVAKNEIDTTTTTNYQLVSLDGYVLTGVDGLILTTGG